MNRLLDYIVGSLERQDQEEESKSIPLVGKPNDILFMAPVIGSDAPFQTFTSEIRKGNFLFSGEDLGYNIFIDPERLKDDCL